MIISIQHTKTEAERGHPACKGDKAGNPDPGLSNTVAHAHSCLVGQCFSRNPEVTWTHVLILQMMQQVQ